MSGCHWADADVEWIRSLVPELASERIYIRMDSELPDEFRATTSIAYVNKYLDLQMMPILKERNQWCGRGYAVVWNEACFLKLSSQKRQAILLHEFSHQFERGRQSWPDFEDLSKLDQVVASPGGLQSLIRQSELDESVIDYQAITKIHHGVQFARAGLHLWWRTRFTIDAPLMVLFGSGYGSSALEYDAINALAGELRAGGDLFDILASDPPAAFVSLFSGKTVGTPRHPG